MPRGIVPGVGRVFTQRWLECRFCLGPFRRLRATARDDFSTGFEPMALLVHADNTPIADGEPWRCDTCGADHVDKRPHRIVRGDDPGTIQLASTVGFTIREGERFPEPAIEHVVRPGDRAARHRLVGGPCPCGPVPARRGPLIRIHHNDPAGEALGLLPIPYWVPPPPAP